MFALTPWIISATECSRKTWQPFAKATDICSRILWRNPETIRINRMVRAKCPLFSRRPHKTVHTLTPIAITAWHENGTLLLLYQPLHIIRRRNNTQYDGREKTNGWSWRFGHSSECNAWWRFFEKQFDGSRSQHGIQIVHELEVTNQTSQVPPSNQQFINTQWYWHGRHGKDVRSIHLEYVPYDHQVQDGAILSSSRRAWGLNAENGGLWFIRSDRHWSNS